MRITMQYHGGAHDGQVVFDDDAPSESLTWRQQLARDHYELTDRGNVGAIFIAGSPDRSSDGAHEYEYSVEERWRGKDGLKIVLRLTGRFCHGPDCDFG